MTTTDLASGRSRRRPPLTIGTTLWLPRPSARFVVGLAGWLCAGLAGCGLCGDVVCGACPSPLTLRISDEQTGQAIDDVTVLGGEALCDQPVGADYTSCDVQVAVGDHELVLSAPGYEDETVVVTINPDSGESCCSCGYNAKLLDVTMTPTP